MTTTMMMMMILGDFAAIALFVSSQDFASELRLLHFVVALQSFLAAAVQPSLVLCLLARYLHVQRCLRLQTRTGRGHRSSIQTLPCVSVFVVVVAAAAAAAVAVVAVVAAVVVQPTMVQPHVGGRKTSWSKPMKKSAHKMLVAGVCRRMCGEMGESGYVPLWCAVVLP